MDHSKFSSNNLLSFEFVETPFGSVCNKMDVKCTRCREEYKITVPDSMINKVDSEEQTGTAIIEYVLEIKGWAHTMIKRKGEIPALYTICPACVEKDFKPLEE